MNSHPRHDLDELINTPVRFSLMAALVTGDEIEFRALRDAVEISDSLLSQHIRVLERAGYVQVRKGHVGKRPRTWLAATPAGAAAFHTHYAALRAIAEPGATRPAAERSR